jgi:transcriptional regulator with XRE-family HTH domain
MSPFCERVLSASRIDYLPSHNRGIPVPKNPITIGGHLRKKRLQLRLFQSEAASRLKVSTVTLSRWECDKAYPAWQYQTQAEHLLKVLENGSVSTNISFAPCPQLCFGHELVAVAGATKEALARHQVQREARHHLGRAPGHRCPRIKSRTKSVLPARVALGRGTIGHRFP